MGGASPHLAAAGEAAGRGRSWCRSAAGTSSALLGLVSGIKGVFMGVGWRSICVYVNLLTYTSIYIYASTCTCAHIYIYICMYVHMYMFICTYVYIYIHVRVYIYMYVYVHIHMYAYVACLIPKPPRHSSIAPPTGSVDILRPPHSLRTLRGLRAAKELLHRIELVRLPLLCTTALGGLHRDAGGLWQPCPMRSPPFTPATKHGTATNEPKPRFQLKHLPIFQNPTPSLGSRRCVSRKQGPAPPQTTTMYASSGGVTRSVFRLASALRLLCW